MAARSTNKSDRICISIIFILIIAFLVRGGTKINSHGITISPVDTSLYSFDPLDSLDFEGSITHFYYIFFNSDDKYIEVEDINDTVVINSNCIIDIKYLEDGRVKIITDFVYDRKKFMNYEEF